MLLFIISDRSSGYLLFYIFSKVLLQSFKQSEGLFSYRYKKERYYAADKLFYAWTIAFYRYNIAYSAFKVRDLRSKANDVS